jgi:hypothetical protein
MARSSAENKLHRVIFAIPKKWLLPIPRIPCFICRTQNMNAQLVSPAELGRAKFAGDS